MTAKNLTTHKDKDKSNHINSEDAEKKNIKPVKMIMEAEDVKEIPATSHIEEKHVEESKISEIPPQTVKETEQPRQQENRIDPAEIQKIIEEKKNEDRKESIDVGDFNANDFAELQEPVKEINNKIKIITSSWPHISKYRILTKIYDESRIIKINTS